MGKPYKVCPDCGANLDAGERCDCRNQQEQTDSAAEARHMKLVAVCREVDKDTGRVAVYPLDMEITGTAIQQLQLRAQFNPELRYFALTTGRWERFGDVITSILKRRAVARADVDRIGGIVEL